MKREVTEMKQIIYYPQTQEFHLSNDRITVEFEHTNVSLQRKAL